MRQINWKHNWQGKAQLIAVLLAAALVKFYYSTASVNELRWILAPTTKLVELVTGASFEFESHAGYMSSDHTFLIAASCAGVNFLITAFLMLSLRKLWREREKAVRWNFFLLAAVIAYLVTIGANTARISFALTLRGTPYNLGLNPEQLHRFEGIFVYFGCLMLMFLISERLSYDVAQGQRVLWPSSETSTNRLGWSRRSLFPLLIYYAVTLGIPLANGAYRKGTDFGEHTLFVLLTPLLLVLPMIAWGFLRYRAACAARVSMKPGA